MSFDKHGAGYLAPRTMAQIDRLHAWQHDEYFAPAVVEINPTAICNQKCRYCYSYGRTDGNMDDQVLLGLLPQLAEAGVKAAVFQGTGEPFMHKYLPEAIESAADCDIAVSITTNAVLFKPEIQKRILKHLAYMKFSVLDDDPARYARTHGCSEKQWEMMIENLKHAVALRNAENIDVFFLATVYLTRENFHDAARIVEYFKELGLDYISVQEAVYSEYSITGPEPLASDSFSSEEIEKMKASVLALKDEKFFTRVRFPLTDSSFQNGRDKDNWVNHWCQGIKFNALINTDGEVYPCFRYWGNTDYSYGNVYCQTFEEVWKSRKRKQLVDYTNITPPEGDECSICNVTKINDILWDIKSANEKKWKDFLI